MTDMHREYEFSEWTLLSEDDQLDIINHYWNPYKPENGQKTRQKIIASLKAMISGPLDYCEFRHFEFYANSLFVIPADPTTRIPTSFAGLTITTGR